MILLFLPHGTLVTKSTNRYTLPPIDIPMYQEDAYDAESVREKFRLPPPFAKPWVTLETAVFRGLRDDEKTPDMLKRKPGKKIYPSSATEENDLTRRREVYATKCRELAEQQLQGRYQVLNNVASSAITMMSEEDQETFPVMSYQRPYIEPGFLTVYLHGGGLKIGEADSEAISCRLLAHHFDTVVYSVGYRLIFKDAAEKAFQDAKSVYNQAKRLHNNKRILLPGSGAHTKFPATTVPDSFRSF
jgi:acetyl esterase/lipase